MAVTPLAVFDELWAAFSYHCAFLHLRSSTRNWHLASFRETYRARAAALPQTNRPLQAVGQRVVQDRKVLGYAA